MAIAPFTYRQPGERYISRFSTGPRTRNTDVPGSFFVGMEFTGVWLHYQQVRPAIFAASPNGRVDTPAYQQWYLANIQGQSENNRGGRPSAYYPINRWLPPDCDHFYLIFCQPTPGIVETYTPDMAGRGIRRFYAVEFNLPITAEQIQNSIRRQIGTIEINTRKTP